MMRDLELFFHRLKRVVNDAGPHETDRDRERGQFFVIWVLLMAAGAAVWLVICFVHGLWVPAVAPAVYIVLAAANLWRYHRRHSFRRVRFVQMLASLSLPFLFQWSLGGFVQSGAAILWAITAMFVSLTFQSTRRAVRWVGAFLVLAAVSGPIDGKTAAYAAPMSDGFETWLFVINIVGMTAVVFGLLWYFVRQRERALAEITRKNIELVDSQIRLVKAEKMASIGSLAAGIAHEMNNPVGVVGSSAEVVARCARGIGDKVESAGSVEALRDDPEFRRLLGVLGDSSRAVVDSSGRLKEVADRLKRFVRLDQTALQSTDLHEDIDNTLAVLSSEIPGGVKIVKHYGDIPSVTCRPGEINQVFMNVLRNAVDAVADGGTVTIVTGLEDGRVHVRVSDDGPGIPRDRLRRLFDPGFFGKSGRVRAGMGLLLSRQIIVGHGGDIDIESEVGRGTTVTIVLPAGAAETGEAPVPMSR